MQKEKKAARMIGILYLIGTAAGVLSVAVTGPIRNSPSYFSNLPAGESQLILGAILILIMGLALALIPVVFYPIGRKKNQVLALGYLLFRGALETFTYLAVALSWFYLVTLRRTPHHAGVLPSMNYQALGEFLLEGAATSTLTTIVFILGAVMFYALLDKNRMVPRWISRWGLIAAVPYLAAGFLVIFDLTGHMSTADTLLRVPLGIQEMVLAVWLIVKGFAPKKDPPKTSYV